MTYRTIVADPPWPITWKGGMTRRAGRKGPERRVFKRELPYAVMSIEAIENLPIASLASADSHLYLWVPDCFALEGVGARVARAWGFKPGRFLVWEKAGYGLGTFPRPQHELVLICKRGALPFQIRDTGSVHRWKMTYINGARYHSAKPEGFLDLVERASPAPRLELFARRQRLGWDTWGDQALEHVVLEAPTP